MPKYNVVITYNNLDAEDLDALELILVDLPDSHVYAVDGRTRLEAVVNAECSGDAVEEIVHAVHRADPNSMPDAVELDLVSISDIALEVGLNREAVRLWTLGRRGPGNFPAAVDILADRVKVWAAADVWGWLSEHKLPHTEARPLTMTEVVDGNRTVERIKRAWAQRPTLLEATQWHTVGESHATVSLKPTVKRVS